MKDIITTSYKDFSVRKLSPQDYYEENQGLKHNFIKIEGLTCKKKGKGPLVNESKRYRGQNIKIRTCLRRFL
jgi:hypothetical protein